MSADWPVVSGSPSKATVASGELALGTGLNMDFTAEFGALGAASRAFQPGFSIYRNSHSPVFGKYMVMFTRLR